MAASTAQAGVPIKLLHEGEGQVVIVELKNGEAYRGVLTEAEDTMNCQLKDVTLTSRDGRVSKLEQVYLRGGQIKFIVLPDSLKASTVFRKVQKLSREKKERELTAGRGRGRGNKRTTR